MPEGGKARAREGRRSARSPEGEWRRRSSIERPRFGLGENHERAVAEVARVLPGHVARVRAGVRVIDRVRGLEMGDRLVMVVMGFVRDEAFGGKREGHQDEEKSEDSSHGDRAVTCDGPVRQGSGRNTESRGSYPLEIAPKLAG